MDPHQDHQAHRLQVDLENVSERLHVDARTLARKLQQAEGGTELAVDMDTLDSMVTGEMVEVVKPQRSYASTEQLRPAKNPLLLKTPSKGHRPKAQTPSLHPGRKGKMVRWWVSGNGAIRPNAYVHGALIDRNEPITVDVAMHERTPLLGRTPRPTSHHFHGHPVGALQTPNPITAFVLPVDEQSAIVAVVDEEPPTAPGTSRLFPDEIKRVEVRLREDKDHKMHLYLVMEFARPFIGWFILLVGVTCMAAVGPVIKMMSRNNVSGFIVGSWNAQGLFIMFSTAALLQGQIGDREISYLTSSFGFLLLAAAGTISGLGSGCWTLSFIYTSVPQSYLFNSFHPSLIIAWRLFLGRSVITEEKLGVLLGLTGAAMSVLDGGGGPNVPLGDMLAFLSSLSLCFYLLASKKARNHLPLMLNLAFVTFFSAVAQSIVAHIMTPGGLTFDTDPQTGVFGWWNPIHFNTWLLVNLVTGVGQAGYIGALKYLNPVVVSICMTTEPVTATLFAMMLLGEGLPKMYTVLGGILIIISSAVVSVYSVHSKENVEIDVEADTVELAEDESGHTSSHVRPSPCHLPQNTSFTPAAPMNSNGAAGTPQRREKYNPNKNPA